MDKEVREKVINAIRANPGFRATIADTLLNIIEAQAEALERINGMCDVGPTCSCGRPNGLPAVISCSTTAITETNKLLKQLCGGEI